MATPLPVAYEYVEVPAPRKKVSRLGLVLASVATLAAVGGGVYGITSWQLDSTEQAALPETGVSAVVETQTTATDTNVVEPSVTETVYVVPLKLFEVSWPEIAVDISGGCTMEGINDGVNRLTAFSNGISPTPEKVTYQWYRDGAEVPGATLQSFDAGPTYDGEIKVVVTAEKDGYQTQTFTGFPCVGLD